MNRPRIPRKTLLRPIVWVMLGVVGLMLPAGLFAAGRIGSIEQGYVLGRQQAEELALERENQKLTLEVSTLRAPARLERLARERLRMAAPGNGDLLMEGGGSPQSSLGRALAERR
jgi:cell division protein FtsL